MLESTSVVIRTSNERTFGLCRELCLRQTLKDNLKIVQEVPFERALRKCYEIGIETDKKWMVTVDGDVFMANGAIETLVQNAELMPQNYFHLQGRIFDKITGLYRQAGHRIYRTELLPLALSHIPPDGFQIRPEYFTLQQMGKIGHSSRCIPDVVGLHDFEQYYFDIYRKSFVHAIKHPHWVKDLIERCTKLLHKDPDFLVVMKGLWDGLTTERSVSIDRRKFLNCGEKALKSLGIAEKGAIEGLECFVNEFAGYYRTATNHNSPPDFETCDEPSHHSSLESGWYAEICRRIQSRGLLHGGGAIVGALFKRVGAFLDG